MVGPALADRLALGDVPAAEIEGGALLPCPPFGGSELLGVALKLVTAVSAGDQAGQEVVGVLPTALRVLAMGSVLVPFPAELLGLLEQLARDERLVGAGDDDPILDGVGFAFPDVMTSPFDRVALGDPVELTLGPPVPDRVPGVGLAADDVLDGREAPGALATTGIPPL